MTSIGHPRLRSWILALAIALRVVLALVNTDANDNHLAVVRIIVDENRFPDLHEAFQAYHSKLYHASVALLWKLSPIDSPYLFIRVGQLFNTFFGVWTLLLIRRWLAEMSLSEPVRTLIFALVALNPGLVAIHSQATNDTLVIWMSTLALIAAGRYLAEPSRSGFWRMLWPTVLGPLAKASGFIVAFSIAGAFGLQVLHRRSARPLRTIVAAAALLAVTCAAAFALGSYGKHWRQYGDPFILNMPRNPLPDFWEETEFRRPGARSIAGALGTFHFFDLMQRPQIARPAEWPNPIEKHRTSLWTQLFARTHFAQYDNHPETWINHGKSLLWLARALYLFGLPWSLLLLGGMVVEGWKAAWFRNPLYAPAMVAAWMQIAFIAQFCLVYRDFASMKVIYILPGMAGYVLALATATEWVWRKGWRRSVMGGGTILAVLYAVDAAWLSGHLLADKLPMLWELVRTRLG